MTDEGLHLFDPTGLLDDLNRLEQAYEEGGEKGLLSKMLAELENDPVGYLKVVAAFFPDMVREAIKEEMGEVGEDDLLNLLAKLQGLVSYQ